MNRRTFALKVLPATLVGGLALLGGCGAKNDEDAGNAFDHLPISPIPSALTHLAPPSHAVSVRSYGALGNGVDDDRPAIAAALNAVSDQGGGAIWLPAGTYLLRSFSLPGKKVFFELPANVSIYGPGTLKVAAHLGEWSAVFCQVNSSKPLTGCIYAGFEIDHNSQNNPLVVNPTPYRETRQGFLLLSGKDIAIQQVIQRNLISRQAIISFNVDGLVIADCKFLNVGAGDTDYDFDSSLLYLVGDGYRVSRCTFQRTGMGGRTAIELHGRNFICEGNQIDNFTTGIIVASDARFNRLDHGEIAGNHMTVRSGISLWPTDGPIIALNLHHNDITLNRALTETVDSKTHSQSKDVANGIEWSVGQANAISRLAITDNTIRFIHENKAYGSQCRAFGMLLDPHTVSARLDDVLIRHNQILHAPGDAVRLANLDLNNVLIEGNVIVDPESGLIPGSGTAIELKQRGGYQKVRVINNQVVLTRRQPAFKTVVTAPGEVLVSNNILKQT